MRVFRDGDFVFTHTEYDFFGPKVGFDVFRFEDGKVVEHWDNLAEKAKQPNRSGHTQTDGPTEAKDLEKTEANKTLVRAFYEDILMQGKKEKLADYFGGHVHPAQPRPRRRCRGLRPPGRDGRHPNSPIRFEKIRKVLGEGDFVLVMSEGSFRGKSLGLLRPVPGRGRQGRRALGCDRDYPAQDGVEERQREVLEGVAALMALMKFLQPLVDLTPATSWDCRRPRAGPLRAESDRRNWEQVIRRFGTVTVRNSHPGQIRHPARNCGKAGPVHENIPGGS